MCRESGRLKELIVDGCGVQSEGCAALAFALTQPPPPFQKQHQPSQHPQPVASLSDSSQPQPALSAVAAGHRGDASHHGNIDLLFHKSGGLGEQVHWSCDGPGGGRAPLGGVLTSIPKGRCVRGLVKLDLSHNNIGLQGLLSLSGSVPYITTLLELVLKDCQVILGVLYNSLTSWSFQALGLGCHHNPHVVHVRLD